MRRLLYFGTGAAIIGIILLVAAFFAAYDIVSNLQNELATNTNVNLVLEDATIEAVFLGIMASMGYLLVSQGLGGIRREEILELESSMEDAVVIRDQNMKLRAAARPSVQRTKAKQEEAKGPLADSTAQPAVSTEPIVVAQTSSGSDTSQTVQETKPSQPADFSWNNAPVEPRAGIQSAPATTETSPTSAAMTTAEAQTASAEAAEPQAPISSTAVAPSNDSQAVVWEGGPPPKLEGVEVLPEPPEHGVLGVEKPDDDSTQISASQDSSLTQISPPKRGRGRPKGSKNKKSDQQSGSNDQGDQSSSGQS